MALVNVTKRDGIALFELEAGKANTYSYEMMRELDRGILDARMDESVHVLMLTGAGDKFFCAGADIAMLDSGGHQGQPGEARPGVQGELTW
jgi:enoyl-CoA hydratase